MTSKFKFYENECWSHVKIIDQIKPQLCTYHNCSAVVACTKLWPDEIIIIKIGAKVFLPRFELWAHKLFVKWLLGFNTLRPRQNGRHFPDDFFKWIFLNENVWISINISLKFVPRGPINNIPTFVQVMAWRWPSDKPLSEPMMIRLPTHWCVTRPQWVNRPSDAMLWHRSRSVLAQVMACWLMAPSHYLNQCWLIMSKILWYSPQYNFTANAYCLWYLTLT